MVGLGGCQYFWNMGHIWKLGRPLWALQKLTSHKHILTSHTYHTTTHTHNHTTAHITCNLHTLQWHPQLYIKPTKTQPHTRSFCLTLYPLALRLETKISHPCIHMFTSDGASGLCAKNLFQLSHRVKFSYWWFPWRTILKDTIPVCILSSFRAVENDSMCWMLELLPNQFKFKHFDI